jgi:hypothetical protein
MAIKIPKTQTLWVTHMVDGKPQYVITSDLQRTKYFLNKVDEDGKLTKLKTSKYPLFEEVGNK